ncbi:MAG: hypothetical protein ACYC9Y_10235 [Candidatus Methylomirabilia bacterium]
MMLRLERVSTAVRAKAAPFLEELAKLAGPGLHSLHLVGSAVTTDWSAGRSDINTLLVLQQMDLAVLESIAPLGRRFKGSGIAPPLVMDPGYIASSRDVFPMEFLEMRLIHETVLGEDILASVKIDRGDLRLQCEREIKSRLLGLRQEYLRSLGEPKALTASLLRFLSGYQPLARGILVLLGKEPPLRRAEAFASLAAAVGPEAGVFVELLAVKEGRAKPDAAGVRDLFERCHKATERLGRIIDEHTV